MANVKKFLQKWIVNNIGFKILAVVFAFVLWLVITNTTDPVTNRTITGIPVTIENEALVLDGNHVYTVVSGNTATVVVSGNRSVIGNLTVSDFIATADFSELSLTNAVPINVELTGEKARYASSVSISLKTNSMIISLEDMDKTTLNVEVQYTGEQSGDILVDNASVNPAKVTLHAPESVINQVDKAVAQVDYSEVTGDVTLQKQLVLYDRNGSQIEMNADTYLEETQVDVNITTSRVKSVPVSIEPVGTPEDGYEIADVVYSKNNVSIRGTAEALDQITEIVLPSTLLNVQGANADVAVDVNMEDYLPAGVSFYGDAGTITITATISEVETETETTTEANDTNNDNTTETEEETTVEG